MMTVCLTAGCAAQPQAVRLTTVTSLPVASPSPAPTPAPIYTPTPTPMPTPTEEPPTEAAILLVGDLMCLKAQQNTARTEEGFDFSPSFSHVRELFAGADYVVGNLETTVSPSAPLTSQLGDTDMPVLNAPPEFLDALSEAGVSAVSTVNNHCVDAGATGVAETTEALETRGIGYVGTNARPDGSRFLLADVNGIKVAVLAYSEIFNQKQYQLTEEQREYMIHEYAAERVAEDAAAAREAGAEFIIAYTHWGIENEASPNAAQREHAQAFADAGVDVIAGSHPHRLQAAEYITSAAGRQTLCLYSLGNFVSSMAQQHHNDTAVIELRLVKEGGTVTLKEAGYYPYQVKNSQEEGSFVVVPADEAAGARIAGALGGALELLGQVTAE